MHNKKNIVIAIGLAAATGSAWAGGYHDICNTERKAELIGQIATIKLVKIQERLATCSPSNISSQGRFQISSNTLDTVSNRIEILRDADLLAIAEASPTSLQASSNGIAQGLQATKALRYGAWFKATGAQAHETASNGISGYKSRSTGVTAGLDQELDSGTVVGGAFTVTNTDVNMTDAQTGSGSNIQGYQATGYMSHDFGTWHMDGLVAYTHQLTSSQRATGGGLASAEYGGELVSTRLTAGKRIQIKQTRLYATPFVSVQYSHLSQSGYSETGPGALTVARANSESLRTGTGVRLSGETAVAGRSIKPSVYAQWLHEFVPDGLNTSGTTVGGGTAFVSQGQKNIANMLGLGGSLMMPVARNAAVSLAYGYEGAGHYTNHTYELIYQYWF